MKIIEWLRNIFSGTDKGVIHVTDSLQNQWAFLSFERFYVDLAVNMIAGAAARCEFQTFEKGRPCKSEEYYLWNYAPNGNQSGFQFKQELVSKILKNNEALVVEAGGRLLIADSFTREENALGEDVFRSVHRGDTTLSRDFTAGEVLYFQNNNGNVRPLLAAISQGYGELLNLAVGKYRRAGGRKGMVRANKTASGNGKTDEDLDKLFREKFKSYFNDENAVIHMPNGIDYTEIHGEGSKKSTSELTDIINIMEEAARAVGLAFRIPPALLLGKVADLSGPTQNALTFCVDPLMDSIGVEITRKRYGAKAWADGWYLAADTSRIVHTDVFGTAEQADKLIASGLYSIDELREKSGAYPLETDWSRAHFQTKNYAELVKGGEKNG